MNAPFATVPFSPSSDQVAAVSSRRKRPLSSNSRARSFTVWPGVSTSSVGDTCRCAGAPCAGLRRLVDGEPGDGLAPAASRSRRPRRSTRRRCGRARSAAPPRICSGVPSEPQQLFVLFGSSTSLRISRAVGVRPDDEELAAVGADVDLAVGQHRRRLLRGAERQRPQLLAGRRCRRPSASSCCRSDRGACRR